MSTGLWTRRPPPIGTNATVLGRWQPTDVRQLTGCRRQLAAALHGSGRPAGVDDGAVERLLLVFEEIGSNALRHGRPPVTVTIWTFDHFWLVEAADAAVDSPPTPAVDRDAAEGGLGLYVVARVCGAHGWTVRDDHKVAWARIDYTRAEAPPDVVDALPLPRPTVD